ncbi:MAG: phosphoribosylanthranilate isomerase [Armatimonadetes bacterium]|nr:phosphoribosylanthranilate isomerase [Armatimonadota bacterium]
MVRVKICGLTRHEDVEAAVGAGADAVGFVRHPASKRFVEEGEARTLATVAGPFVERVLVYDVAGPVEDPGFLIQARQFEGGLDRADVRRVQVLAVAPETTLQDLLESAHRTAPGVEAVLLDASHEGRTGGTGRPLDWGLAAAFVAEWNGPVVLAGGLTPDNVAVAVRTVQPYAVDVCSGTESGPGIKDLIKVQDFIAAARSA